MSIFYKPCSGCSGGLLSFIAVLLCVNPVLPRLDRERLPEFSFLYNDITISQTYITISWSPTNNCSGVVKYYVVIALFSEPNVRIFTLQSRYSINKAILLAMREHYTIFVEAFCNNNIHMQSDVSLNFSSEVTTEEKELRRNQNICFHLNNQDPTVIWPNSANGSCVCQGWYHIADCGCNSNMLVYNQGFNFMDLEICWTNLNNNTKLHFVLESSNPVDVQNLVQEPQVNRYFQSSYNIVIKETETFSFLYGSISIDDASANVIWVQPPQCMNSEAQYTVHRFFQGEVLNESIYSHVSTNSVKISKDLFQVNDIERYKYYIEANCNNTLFLSDTSIQFSKEVLTLKVQFETSSDVCLMPGNSTLTVIFPKSNNSADGNCICNHCLQIQQCSCLTNTNFFEVYNQGEAIDVKICWKNMKNNTIIHFVFESLNNRDELHPNFYPLINRDIIESYEIVIMDAVIISSETTDSSVQSGHFSLVSVVLPIIILIFVV